MSKTQQIENLSNIESFFHCSKCMKEIPSGVSPRDWQKNEVGFTKKGLQVWCIRHEENVIHLDFLGQKVGLAD